MITTHPPVALTIAGSDSGAGAGLQADLKTFAALGVYGTSVVTAVTAQNTVGVDAVHVLPAAAVTAQLDAVTRDLPVVAVKTGMLATTELVELVADRAADGDLPQLVVDPVLVSATGHRLLEDEAIATYREQLFPHAQVVTPNLPEAAVLVGRELRGRDDQVAAARELADDGIPVVVVKGGHAQDQPHAVDVVVLAGEVHLLEGTWVHSQNVHGTGCTFAAAIAAGLAAGRTPLASLQRAKQYVTTAIWAASPWELGAGAGPLDHLGTSALGPLFTDDGWRLRPGT